MSAERARPTDVALPPDRVAKLGGTTQITNYGWIKLRLYNGSSSTIHRVVVEVRVPDMAIQRRYVLYREDGASGAPLESSRFHGALGFTVRPDQAWSFDVVQAFAPMRNSSARRSATPLSCRSGVRSQDR
jgi:hypothetical protein